MKTADQSSRNVRLGMAILVRDEEDIIADNIRFHMTQGVETFIVTDNGSVDGTREILESLRGEIDIEIIDEASHTIDQDLWMTRMACRLREQGRADWVILGDADEFWVSRSGDLRSEITPRRGVHECATHNMLPRQSDVLRQDYRFFCNVMKVARPLGHIPPQPDPEQPLSCAIVLGGLAGGKVMCELEGLRSVSMGNHEVAHRKKRLRQSKTVSIYHYPIRSYDQFRKKVLNYGASLKRNRRHRPLTSWHHRRWYAQYERGELEAEYQNLILKDQQARSFEKKGVLARDETLLRHFLTQL